MSIVQELKDKIGFNQAFDFTERVLKNNNHSVTFLYNSFLTDSLVILKLLEDFNNIQEIIDKHNFIKIMNNTYSAQSLFESNSINELTDHLFNGDLVIIYDDEFPGIYIDTKNYPSRSLQEPDSEKVVRGSRDGFTENLSNNIALLRRRIKDGNLVLKLYEVGTISKTKVVLTYLDDVIKKETKEEIMKRLDTLKVKELTLTDKALEELLVNNVLSPYPLVKYTERPDTLAMHLYQGMFGIMVDTSPSAILGPVSVFDHLQHAEEFRQTVIAGTYLRIIRFLGIVCAFFSIPLWLALISMNVVVPGLESFFTPDNNYHSLFIQLFIALIGIELIRMASIHTPTALSTSMGLISGIIIGDMAIKVGLVSEQVVILSAISAIGSFITPSYELSLASKMANLVLTILVYLFKMPGFIIGTLLIILHLACLKSFKRPYLYPLIPFNLKDLVKQMVRIPYKQKEKIKIHKQKE